MRTLDTNEVERVSGAGFGGFGGFVAGAAAGWALGEFVFSPTWEWLKRRDFDGMGESYKDYIHKEIADGSYHND